MGIMSFESLMDSVVVTADVTAGDLFSAMCTRKGHLTRMVYNLAINKGKDHIALFPQLRGGIEIKVTNISDRKSLRDSAYVPFDSEAIYVEAEAVADFQADNGDRSMAELNILHAGDHVFLVCLLNPGKGPKAYLMSGAHVSFLDQLREVESASRALSSDDKAAPIPVPAESTFSPAPAEQPEVVPAQAPPLVPSYDYSEPNLKNPTSASTPTPVSEDNGMLSMDEINAILNGPSETATYEDEGGVSQGLPVPEDLAEVMQDVDVAGQNDDLVLAAEAESEETDEDEEGGLYIP